MSVRPLHLARLSPPWAKPSDAGETRAHSAGQHPGFLSKCLWLGFLLTEGRLQFSSDIPRGGSQGPGHQARPAGTQRRSPTALHAAVRRHSQGRWGHASRAIKGIPLGREEAVNQTRNAGAQACPGQMAKHASHTAPSRLTDPLASLRSNSLAICKPSPCVLWRVSPTQLPAVPGGLGTGPKHPDYSPPWL